MKTKLCLSLALLTALNLATASAFATIKGNITLHIYNSTDKNLETDNKITNFCTPNNVTLAPNTSATFTCTEGQEMFLYYDAEGATEANYASFEFNHIVVPNSYSYWTRTDSHPTKLGVRFYGTQGSTTDNVYMQPDQAITDIVPSSDLLHVNNYNVTITKLG